MALNEAQNRQVLDIPVKVGDYFTLQYKHSYEKDETWDLYRIESDRFRQVGTAFTFFSYDARNSTYEKGFSLEAGTAKITDMDKNYDVTFKTLEPRIGFTVRQWVILNGNVYQLQAYGQAGDKLVFSVQR